MPRLARRARRPKSGADAELVIIATPDRAIESAALAAAPSLEPGALVVHVAGSRGLDVFDPLLEKRPDVRVGAMHPLQSFPSTTVGLERLPGSWAAVAGDPQVTALAEELGLQPFTLADEERTRYHATAVVSPRTTSSRSSVRSSGSRRRAACPSRRSRRSSRRRSTTRSGSGPPHALTGPVERGDLGTVEAHLRALDPAERDAYRALAREAARLTGRRDSALDRLLGDLRQTGRPGSG